jgi:hypothetical protein
MMQNDVLIGTSFAEYTHLSAEKVREHFPGFAPEILAGRQTGKILGGFY